MSTEHQRQYRQYVTSDDGTIDTDREAILSTLVADARGYDNRLSARELSNRTDINQSTLRDVVIELREEYGVPIGNIGSGYFVITDADELARVVEYYEGEIATKYERLRTIKDCYHNHDTMQPENHTTEPDAGEIRQTICDVADGGASLDRTVAAVVEQTGATPDAVRDEVDALDDSGFVYVDDGEVRTA